MKYGLWDVEGNAWIGDDRGPIAYDDRGIGITAAIIATEMFEQKIECRPLTGAPWEDKGEVEAKYTGGEALERIRRRAEDRDSL